MAAPIAAGGPPGGFRAIAGGGGAAVMAVESQPAAGPEGEAVPLIRPRTFREVVALAIDVRPALHAELKSFVHLVRFALTPEGGRIELRPTAKAPRDLAAQLTSLLAERTGQRWTIVLSNEAGEPTINEQGKQAEVGRFEVAAEHPLVRAVLATFPGTQIRKVRDASLDYYGLPPPEAAPAEEPEVVLADDVNFAPMDDEDFGFAPPDAEPAGMDRP